MSTLVFANNAGTTLSGAINNTATTLNVAAGGGALFPNPTAGQYFVITLIDSATGLLNEIMWCTSRSGDVMTVTRGQESTTPLNWAAGDLVQELWTAGQATAMQQQSQAPSSLIYYGTDTGSVNAMSATVTPAISSLNTGNIFEITPIAANTSKTVVLNISSLGNQNVYRSDGSSLQVGDIQAAPFKALIAWDAATTKFLLLNPATYISEAPTQYLGLDSGSADAYVVTSTTPPFPVGLTAGLQLQMKVHAANTNSGGAATVTVTVAGGGTTTKNITRAGGSPLQAGDLQALQEVLMAWDGTEFQILGLTSTTTPPRNQVILNTAGSGTFTVPTGIYWIFVRQVGGGGGGAFGGNNHAWSSGGGGGGGYSEGWIAVKPGQVCNYTIGAAGAGGTVAGAAGNGGTTTFIAGTTTFTTTGGTGGLGSSTACAGGPSGVGSGGTYNAPGSLGNDGVISANTIPSGFGGASAFGGGGKASTGTSGATALVPGTGGGGIYANSGSPNDQVGGAGVAGQIIIQY